MTESNKLPPEAESEKTTEIAAFVAGGGAVGAITSVVGVGLATALLPVAALGMVIGLAAYGVKQALFDDVESVTPSESNTPTENHSAQVDTNAENSVQSEAAADMGMSD